MITIFDTHRRCGHVSQSYAPPLRTLLCEILVTVMARGTSTGMRDSLVDRRGRRRKRKLWLFLLLHWILTILVVTVHLSLSSSVHQIKLVSWEFTHPIRFYAQPASSFRLFAHRHDLVSYPVSNYGLGVTPMLAVQHTRVVRSADSF
jgi:hypothetical protein